METIAINGALLVYSVTPTAFSLLVANSVIEKSKDAFWTFGYKPEDILCGKILLFVSVNAYESLQIIFPGLLTCMYCTLCYKLSKFLVCFKRKSIEVVGGSSRRLPLKQLVNQYFMILNTVELLQKIFSEPIFLLILMFSLHMFSMVGYLMPFFKYEFTIVNIVEMVVITMTNTLSTVAIIIFASKITANIQKVKQMFQRYKENMILESHGNADPVIQLVIDRENIELSACNIIIF
ncbi:uncharacterized protein CEXT_545851 [Caerostris extrusa]|uniref:Gustatory receptor n=1 Tax=Caerostris extrusa TaxID=172846 RepID=A0AAV4RBD3_CAEEX|nr:uncharacterized protein CEXT_545851 [Caerostris extrusa]